LPEQIEAMNARLRHRGPDAQTTWLSGPVSFGHCMLQVTRESLTERLPLAVEGGDYAITADARIDNRDELIASLWADRPAAIPADSEIILAAYRKWGEGCPLRILGDFAFAIWDRRGQTVFCGCDHMGVKGLYYHLAANAL
jgi:asparagine synthase (glutamine-hydrolysing)